jgi:LysR family transcriptional regulator, low CO2-responsive transcriptional regulator
MSYTLHQLHIFAAVAQEKSMTKAAERLQMSQPAVSIQVKKLQDHFGIELFEVIGKQLYLTEAGRELYQAQILVQQSLENAEMGLSQLRGAIKGSLRIAAVSTAKYVMPYILGAFQKQHANISISLKVSNRAEVISALRENSCDFAVFSQLPTDLALDYTDLMDNPLVFAAAKDHPKLGMQLKVAHLKDEALVLREQGSGTRMVMEELFEKEDMRIDPVMELSTNEGVKHAIMAGIGISLVSEFSLRLEKIHNQIGVLDVEGFPMRSTWKLVHLHGKSLSPLAQTFKTYIQQTELTTSTYGIPTV